MIYVEFQITRNLTRHFGIEESENIDIILYNINKKIDEEIDDFEITLLNEYRENVVNLKDVKVIIISKPIRIREDAIS